MDRNLYTEDHEAFRVAAREFVSREVEPNLAAWDEAGITGRDVWVAAGKQGLVGLSVPVEHGGAGMLRDYRYRNVVIEELHRVGAASLVSSFSLQDDIAVPYVAEIGTEEQRERWLPGMASGEIIGAIAMTEPGTGSDLRGIKTSGVREEGGWRVNGAKTFITNGIQSDLVITVVRTDPEGGPQGFTLMVVAEGMEGFGRGRKLDKIGLVAQDTAELVFEDVFVPDANVLGEVGGGFGQLMQMLPLERLSIAAGAVAGATQVLADTVRYTKEREAFGQPVASFQNTRFQLAEMATEVDVTRTYVDACVRAWNDGTLTAVEAAKAKMWASEVVNRVVDRCLQLHGGYGYMKEYAVARAFVDSRILRIFGGTNEILKTVIAGELLGRRA
ncbi:acyl-CoA dehydrogenase family protein [Nocardioides solisilvae]|uniref:acyl-CoA dehydrogenase family protein n=1 Tax=Nocardioides solisilvae TaxID=1542435 RepID=UPI000D74FA93|nr:acyl-CoA dehydrogenase family protein [Nocardioides solisilvae]